MCGHVWLCVASAWLGACVWQCARAAHLREASRSTLGLFTASLMRFFGGISRNALARHFGRPRWALQAAHAGCTRAAHGGQAVLRLWARQGALSVAPCSVAPQHSRLEVSKIRSCHQWGQKSPPGHLRPRMLPRGTGNAIPGGEDAPAPACILEAVYAAGGQGRKTATLAREALSDALLLFAKRGGYWPNLRCQTAGLTWLIWARYEAAKPHGASRSSHHIFSAPQAASYRACPSRMRRGNIAPPSRLTATVRSRSHNAPLCGGTGS